MAVLMAIYPEEIIHIATWSEMVHTVAYLEIILWPDIVPPLTVPRSHASPGTLLSQSPDTHISTRHQLTDIMPC